MTIGLSLSTDHMLYAQGPQMSITSGCKISRTANSTKVGDMISPDFILANSTDYFEESGGTSSIRGLNHHQLDQLIPDIRHIRKVKSSEHSGFCYNKTSNEQ